MDAYFSVTKLAASSSSKNDNITKRKERKYQPYTLKRNAANDASESKSEQVSAAAVNKFLLSTLSDANNPITTSDIGENIINVVSLSTGHQVAEGLSGNRRSYHEHRTEKLAIQSIESATTQEQRPVLANVRCYINGLLEGTTDMEMKRIITSAGGTVLFTASNATHILTSQYLSGSKTDRLLKSKCSSRTPHVVKPEWVMDSIAAGKRRPERQYSVVKDSTTRNLFDMMKK